MTTPYTSMLPAWALLSTILAVATSPSSSSLPQLTSPLGPVVNLGFAAFAGNSTSPTGELNGPVTFFGGIRYAQPPLGNLRFRAPVGLDESVVVNINGGGGKEREREKE